MNLLLKNATVFWENEFRNVDILVKDGFIFDIAQQIAAVPNALVLDCGNYHVFPGFTDVHVHLREPGFSYKETIQTGTLAAAHGGYTSVCSMPNVKPVPDSMEHLQLQLDQIARQAVVRVYPYASITCDQAGRQLSDFEALSEWVVGFSDDGRGVQQDEIMLQAMQRAVQVHKPIVAHCEVNALLAGGYIHQGEYARQHGHRGICSASEYEQIARDLQFVRQTGCRYHVCHISTKESVSLIRQAKQDGLDVSCETAPHYLVLDDSQLQEDGRFKMNPPLRDASDREALIEGVLDGTIDMIATDHAPHSAEEKARGLEKSAMGVVGLETAFPILYTSLVRCGILTLSKLIDLMSSAPNRRFGIGGTFAVGQPADFCVYDLTQSYRIDPSAFLSKGRATPFAGREVFGACKMTCCNGKMVWKDADI